jgi:hypothetical protein
MTAPGSPAPDSRSLAGAILTVAVMAALPWHAANADVPVGAMKPLGGDRYQIGSVIVDRGQHRLTIPGRVLLLDRPLEYIAVTTGGHKSYESLLEVDATGSDLMLACILLGVDADAASRPRYQFDQQVTSGTPVDVRIAWTLDGARHEVPAAVALGLEGDAAAAAQKGWIYTGSMKYGDTDRYAADVIGSLISFVHDPYSVIEHRQGIGMGQYGSIRGGTTVLPPVGSLVDVIVVVPEANGASPQAAPESPHS